MFDCQMMYRCDKKLTPTLTPAHPHTLHAVFNRIRYMRIAIVV